MTRLKIVRLSYRSNFRHTIGLLVLLVASLILGMILYTNLRDANSVNLEDILMAEYKPTPGRSIFFLETSKHQPPGSSLNGTLNLTARQACAIESAALNNPHSAVFVAFLSPASHNQIIRAPVIEAVRSYPNVHLRSLNLLTFTAYTPVYSWIMDGELFKSKYPIEHISDLVRFLALWRWGGTYLDMDVVVLRSLEDIPPNYMGNFIPKNWLNNAVLNFAQDGLGHEFLTNCLYEFRNNYNGQSWDHNGPGVITRLMKELCHTDKIELMVNGTKSCEGFTVFGSQAFYAQRWELWEQFFDPQYTEEVLSTVKDSYVMHLWNMLSKKGRVKVGSDVAYGKLAEKNCPRAYSAAGEYF